MLKKTIFLLLAMFFVANAYSTGNQFVIDTDTKTFIDGCRNYIKDIEKLDIKDEEYVDKVNDTFAYTTRENTTAIATILQTFRNKNIVDIPAKVKPSEIYYAIFDPDDNYQEEKVLTDIATIGHFCKGKSDLKSVPADVITDYIMHCVTNRLVQCFLKSELFENRFNKVNRRKTFNPLKFGDLFGQSNALRKKLEKKLDPEIQYNGFESSLKMFFPCFTDMEGSSLSCFPGDYFIFIQAHLSKLTIEAKSRDLVKYYKFMQWCYTKIQQAEWICADKPEQESSAKNEGNLDTIKHKGKTKKRKRKRRKKKKKIKKAEKPEPKQEDKAAVVKSKTPTDLPGPKDSAKTVGPVTDEVELTVTQTAKTSTTPNNESEVKAKPQHSKQRVKEKVEQPSSKIVELKQQVLLVKQKIADNNDAMQETQNAIVAVDQHLAKMKETRLAETKAIDAKYGPELNAIDKEIQKLVKDLAELEQAATERDTAIDKESKELQELMQLLQEEG